MHLKLTRTALIGFGLFAATAHAAPWDKPTPTEIAALPPYCTAKISGSYDQGWRATLGSTYDDIHHYCGALVYLSRYYKSRNTQDKKFFLQEVTNNINYMFTHAKPGAKLLHELHYTQGQALSLAGRDGDAAAEYTQAIQLKPDYADPYAALADFYTRIGKKENALKILEDGLKQIPTSRSLARRYQRLGGTVPLPGSDTAPPASSNRQDAPPAAMDPAPTQTDVPPMSEPREPTPAPATPPVAAPAPKIGSPTNPYCRFCPD